MSPRQPQRKSTPSLYDMVQDAIRKSYEAQHRQAKLLLYRDNPMLKALDKPEDK